MKIYISGKISGLDKDEYEFQFKIARRRVFQETDCFLEDIIIPLDIKPLFGIKKWLFYMIADIWQLRKCTHIAMQKNWIDSNGAIIEYFFAKLIFKQKIIWL